MKVLTSNNYKESDDIEHSWNLIIYSLQLFVLIKNYNCKNES